MIGPGVRSTEASTRLTISGDPVDFLRVAIPEYIRFGLANPDEYRIAFLLRDGRRKATRTPEEQRTNVGLSVFKILESRVAAGLESGKLTIPTASSKCAAQTLWASIHGLVALLLAYPDFDWAPVEDLIEAQTNMLLSGLIARSEENAAVGDGTQEAVPEAASKGRRSKKKS
jgi:hypothetical protein